MNVLVVDDDVAFGRRLVESLRLRGHQAESTSNLAGAYQAVTQATFDVVLLDLRLGEEDGQVGLVELKRLVPTARLFILTGFGSIGAAVTAVKAGAEGFLQKPLSTDALLSALAAVATGALSVEDPPSLARVEWEHIQRVLADCGGNISLAARKLGVHRRSLQRKLSKNPPRS